MTPRPRAVPQLQRAFPDVASALAGSPPEPLTPIMPELRTSPEGRYAELPDGTRIGLVVPLPS